MLLDRKGVGRCEGCGRCVLARWSYILALLSCVLARFVRGPGARWEWRVRWCVCVWAGGGGWGGGGESGEEALMMLGRLLFEYFVSEYVCVCVCVYV